MRRTEGEPTDSTSVPPPPPPVPYGNEEKVSAGEQDYTASQDDHPNSADHTDSAATDQLASSAPAGERSIDANAADGSDSATDADGADVSADSADDAICRRLHYRPGSAKIPILTTILQRTLTRAMLIKPMVNLLDRRRSL